MRNIAVVVSAIAALVAGPVMAADLPQYAPPAPPPVDSGLGGAFYLRASAGLNGLWSQNMDYVCGACSASRFDITKWGYGYSVGAGFGYETGTGLRVDTTLDYLSNDHLTTAPGSNIDLSLRSTIALANIYYDFGFGGHLPSDGGFGAYVGAGIGGAYNQVSDNNSSPASSGNSWTAAGAIMAGVTYDMGAYVADLGYRGIYMPTISNNSLIDPYYINQNFISEVRGTLRYRFN